MSALIFDRTLHRIGLVRKLHRELELTGVWAAHNNVDSTSNGPWPQGMYKWSHYKPHPEEGLFPAASHDSYGGMGIHVFTTRSRTTQDLASIAEELLERTTRWAG